MIILNAIIISSLSLMIDDDDDNNIQQQKKSWITEKKQVIPINLYGIIIVIQSERMKEINDNKK